MEKLADDDGYKPSKKHFNDDTQKFTSEVNMFFARFDRTDFL